MKKTLVYILLSLHVFFTGNVGIVLNDYFSSTTAATTILSYVGTATNIATQGNTFLTPTNAQGDTTLTSAVTAFNGNGKISDTLSLTNFNLAAAGLPSNAIINGIQIAVEWNGTNRIIDNNVQLTKDGTVGVGLNRATGATQITKALRTYGSVADLWGTTWTTAELQSATFGVLLDYTSTGGGAHSANVYRLRVTIDYTPIPNNPPTNIILSNNTINEGLPVGTTVGTLTTTDPDVGNTHTYSFACTIPGADSASFTITGSNLNSNAVFNFITKSSYNICIRTSDGLGGTFDKNFVININQVLVVAPGGVSTGLNLWLKANKGTSTTTDGVAISTWSDQSGNAKDATTPGAAPLYRNSDTTMLNYNPVVDFNGTTQYLENTTGGMSSKGYFAVIVPDNQVSGTVTGGVAIGLECLTAGVSTGTCGLPFGGLVLGAFTAAIPDEVLTHALGSSTNWRSAQTGVETYTASKPILVMVNENATANGTNIFEKGRQLNNSQFNTYQSVTNTNYSLGRSRDAANPFSFDGKIAEVINYNSRLTDANRIKIESYLSLKYGITLKDGTQNYIASDGSTIMWNTATAGTYNNSVFGIGRDNLQELTQIKSKSVNNDAIITLEAVGEGSNITPTFVDMNDKEFFTVSNDNLGNTWVQTGAPIGYDVLTRKWKAQEVGDVGTVTLEFDVADPDFDIPAPSLGTNYFFLYDSNSNGSLADETPSVMINTSGNLWKSNAINIANNQIFTIASLRSTNNIPSNITLSNNALDENVPANITVGTLSTTDADPLDTHTYSLVPGAGDDDNGFFTISGNTGRIVHSPDYEIKTSYTIRVQTNDGNGGLFQKTFTISIFNLFEAVTSNINFESALNNYKYTITSGNWIRSTTNPHAPSVSSFESDIAGLDNTQACFEVTHNSSTPGSIDFYYNVSSQAGADFLRFYIDGIEQGTGWSGTIPWTQYISASIPAGSHIYRWCYIKDGATAGGTDTAFIDDITFTNTASDTTPPTIDSTNFASGSLLPGGNHDITINYSDADSGINSASTIMQLYKWDGVSAYGANIAGTGITFNSASTSTANYSTNGLSFGKYQYRFSISDNDGNPVVYVHDFYIDQPEFIVGSGSIDIGELSSLSNKFSDTVTITVKTVGAAFDVTMDRSSTFSEGLEEIPSYNGSIGYGYQKAPYASNISPILTSQNIASQTSIINTNGNKNTYTYDIQIGALIELQQAAGNYVGNLDFGINLTY